MFLRLAHILLWSALVLALAGVSRVEGDGLVQETGPTYASSQQRDPAAYVGVTHPERAARIGGSRSGRIVELLAAPGDTVEAGQVLFELENEVERLDYERLKLRAASTATVELAEARLTKAEAEAERVRDLVERDIESEADRIDAEADLRIARAELASAKEAQQQLVVERDRAKARYEQLRARSPFAGRVEHVHHFAGESIDQLEPVLDLVSLRALHVEFPCPVEALQHWVPGAIAEVRQVDGDLLREAVVVFRGRRSDIASQTAMVRLRMDNEDGAWLAGRKVEIRWKRAVDAARPPHGGRGK